jgi:hypothetical protein
MITEFTAHIIGVGPKDMKYDLSFADAAVIKYLQSLCGMFSEFPEGRFESRYQHCATKYRLITHCEITDKGVEDITLPLKIKVADYPLDEDHICTLKRDKLPERLQKEGRMGLVAKLSRRVPHFLDGHTNEDGSGWATYEGEIVSARDLYNRSQAIFNIMKKSAKLIFPTRELIILYGNSTRLFTPLKFLGYLKRNDNGVCANFGMLEE